MKGGVWFAAGATVGIYGMVKVRRLTEALTPDGMRDRVNAAVVGARIFRDEVAQGQVDAETQLREHFRAVEAGQHRAGQTHELPTRSTTTAVPAARTLEGPQ
ncbi:MULTISPECIES: DUF6167 family protein [unclassified Nocardioides]|uniref:DUF6167 family protein n=1 Tax=unclassified Nocardioides TaxID=2615069 RepID=UPI0006FD6D0B|nr:MULTISPECIES: DUF6167 family protein [unclassified Nocardioides]KRA32675.1 hypothetical protein ASD81_14220 [Nocardioides sp. Root614]KRA89328.1 hypothetical protein ASD84_14485 [Nocardioides sp. Root682]